MTNILSRLGLLLRYYIEKEQAPACKQKKGHCEFYGKILPKFNLKCHEHYTTISGSACDNSALHDHPLYDKGLACDCGRSGVFY